MAKLSETITFPTDLSGVKEGDPLKTAAYLQKMIKEITKAYENIATTVNQNNKQQSALTAADATVIDATYGATEEAVLNNVRTRVNELETGLQALSLFP